jgi:hypothetical protein
LFLYFIHLSFCYSYRYIVDFECIGDKFFFSLTVNDCLKCAEKRKRGGLGIKNLKAFNLALLGKWEWRIRNEKNSLWVKVLSSKYGESNGRVNRNGRHCSIWWRDLQTIDRGVWGFKTGWFISRKIGNGEETLFWIDPWLEGRAMKNRYPSLFLLAENNDITVKGLLQGQGERRQGVFRWCRSLSDVEKRLESELLDEVQLIQLNEYEKDKRMWSRNGYSVKEAYSSIIGEYVAEDSRDLAAVWNGLIPLKVSAFVWRLLQNRIPSRGNLIKRGVLNESQKFCLCFLSVACVFGLWFR